MSPSRKRMMRRVAAIVTDQGGRTAHAAIVSREFGLPCVVGIKDATQRIANGMLVTVDGDRGVCTIVSNIESNGGGL